jgi:hypothetical protein
VNCGIVPQIKSWLLPSKPLPIHHSLIMLFI